jgi:hypothetical protein
MVGGRHSLLTFKFNYLAVKFWCVVNFFNFLFYPRLILFFFFLRRRYRTGSRCFLQLCQRFATLRTCKVKVVVFLKVGAESFRFAHFLCHTLRHRLDPTAFLFWCNPSSVLPNFLFSAVPQWVGGVSTCSVENQGGDDTCTLKLQCAR